VLLVALGVAILVRTVVLGGHGLAYGFMFGSLLILAGLLRLYLSTRFRG
jgi:hypothetical protein